MVKPIPAPLAERHLPGHQGIATPILLTECCTPRKSYVKALTPSVTVLVGGNFRGRLGLDEVPREGNPVMGSVSLPEEEPRAPSLSST